MNNEIITAEQANIIVGDIADSYGPTEGMPQKDFDDTVKNILGKTREEAAAILWPDQKEEQLQIINNLLNPIQDEKA